MVFCFFRRLQIQIFLRVPTVSLSFLKNHKERRLMLWLLLASTFSELGCLWFATWSLEFYWARKASFLWTWCTKEREELCLLSGWKMWRLLMMHSIFIDFQTQAFKPTWLTINVCVVYLSFLQGTLWHRRIVHFWNKSWSPTRDTTFLIINNNSLKTSYVVHKSCDLDLLTATW